MTKKFELAKKEFKEKILEFSTPIKVLNIGSNSRNRIDDDNLDSERDLDIIIVVDNHVDCYEYLKKISAILKSMIIKYEILITAYPIKEEVYLKGESEFLDNVRKHGVEI